MKNKSCLEGETVSVESGDNVIFPNIDSCTAMVLILNTGGIVAAHHVITEEGQEFSRAVAACNAKRLLKRMTYDIGLMGAKVSIAQAVFLGNTIDWGVVDWATILMDIKNTWQCPTTKVELTENQVNIYVFSGMKMIEVHKDSVQKISFQTCINNLTLKI